MRISSWHLDSKYEVTHLTKIIVLYGIHFKSLPDG